MITCDTGSEGSRKNFQHDGALIGWFAPRDLPASDWLTLQRDNVTTWHLPGLLAFRFLFLVDGYALRFSQHLLAFVATTTRDTYLARSPPSPTPPKPPTWQTGHSSEGSTKNNMDVIHLSIPLAGMDPTRKATPDERETAQDRAFRMLSEGELLWCMSHDSALHSCLRCTDIGSGFTSEGLGCVGVIARRHSFSVALNNVSKCSQSPRGRTKKSYSYHACSFIRDLREERRGDRSSLNSFSTQRSQLLPALPVSLSQLACVFSKTRGIVLRGHGPPRGRAQRQAPRPRPRWRRVPRSYIRIHCRSKAGTDLQARIDRRH